MRVADRRANSGGNNQRGAEVVDFGLSNSNGTTGVFLSEQNYETGVSDNLQFVPITLVAGDQILLSLSNDAANNGVIQASYTLEHIVGSVEVPHASTVPFISVAPIF